MPIRWASLMLLAIAPMAAAAAPLDKAGSMAARAGDTIGAAAGCGVEEARLLAVSRTAIELIQQVGASPASLDAARTTFERFAARATRATRSKLELCPAAIADFERAERG